MADMILPKGIVFNRNSIYEEIAKYDIVPLEQILAACHVFTTTSRKLVDPTARRLENFWTRVLGGNRRYLPGTVIARLFKSISEEESFVKLRGPPNRYEPPSPDSKAEPSPRAQAKPETPGEGPYESRSKGKAKVTKVGPSSSTKQPHPILKKPRGPSSSGPRPTARFVSPPGSDGERDNSKDGGLASSGSTAMNHSGDSRVSGATVKEEKRKAINTTPKKKTTAFVASTSSRRRPAMPRRISSQSSSVVSGVEVGSKERSSSIGSRHSGSQSSVSTVVDKPGKEGLSEPEEGGERLSAKAAGKRPNIQLPPDKHSPSRLANIHNQQPVVQDERPDVRQPDPAADDTNRAGTYDASPTKKVDRSGTTHRRSDTQERPRPEVSPIMTRSRSDLGGSRRSSQDLTSGLPPSQSLTSSTTTTISNTIAQGTIIEFDENPRNGEADMNAARRHEDDIEASSRRSGSSVLDTRFTPTQPSTAPTVPLGRSKSQLTLLLERQGEKKPRR